MSQINDEFMEAFKHLDILCKDIFNSDKGITSYINSMENCPYGEQAIPYWNQSLKKLKKLRHIRNSYAHDIGTSYNNICTQSDIDWLNNFYNCILNSTDPLALYEKNTSTYNTTFVPVDRLDKNKKNIQTYDNNHSDVPIHTSMEFISILIIAAALIIAIMLVIYILMFA